MSTILPDKDPRERIPVKFNYTGFTGTLSSYAVSIETVSGGDPNPGAMLDGAPVEESPGVVLQWVTGGVDGVTYKITCVADLSTGRKEVSTGVFLVLTE